MDTKVFEIQAQSVKDLKQQIADLRDEIVRLKSTGQDYSQQVGQLQASQRMLNEVMGASKTEAVALEGSYDAMSKKMKELKKEYQSTTDAMRRAELAPQIRQLNDQLKEMDGNIGNYQRNVGNYASALSNVRQVGGDLSNGFRALSGVMGLTASQQDDLNDSMQAFNAVMGVAQSARGIAGMISQLTQYIGKSKAAKTAQDALNTSMNATGPAMEAGGQAVSKFGQAVNKAIPWLLAIAVAISALVYWWDEVSSAISKFFGWEKKSKEETEELTKANDKLNESFEQQNHDFENQAKLMKAQGKSQKEILIAKQKMVEAQKAETRATIETVQARIREIQAHGWLQRLINSENKERKELENQIKEMEATLKKLDQTTVDISVDIQVEELNDAKSNADKASKAVAEIQKAAAAASAEVAKILGDNLNEYEKIEQEYEATLKKLDKFQQDEYKALNKKDKDYATKKAEIDNRYADARLVLERQKNKKISDQRKKDFEDAYKHRMDVFNLEKKSIEELSDLYEGLTAKLSGTEFRRSIEKGKQALENYNTAMQTAIETYENSGSATDTGIAFLRGLDDDAFMDMYSEYLADEKAFLEKYSYIWENGISEPFISAFKAVGENLVGFRTQYRRNLTDFVNGSVEEIEDAIEKKDVGKALSLFDSLIGNPPVIDDENLYQAATAYVQKSKEQLGKAILDDEKKNPFQQKSLLTLLFGGAENIPEKQMTQLWKNFAKSAVDYSEMATKALGSVAQAWNNIIQRKQADLDKDLEAGKISKKRYEEETKRLKKSFETQQKFSVGLAWVNTALAVVKALATSSTWYEGLINSAIALSTGIAQVESIKAQSYNGGGSGVGSIPQLVDRTPQATVGMNPADFADAQAQNPVKVYVTETDLAEGLRKRRVRVEDTSF